MSAAPGSAPTTNRRQKRMGPAPFASFEDLSDEVRSRLESPEDRHNTSAGSVVRLPGIREDATPTPGTTPIPLTTADRPVAPEIVYTGISLVGAASCIPPPPLPSPSVAMSSVSSPSTTTTTTTRLSLQTSTTPRIDISRASSSSHHDSRDSTPERELFDGQGGATGGTKLGLGFREEGTLDLRSSTEELDYQDPQDKRKGKARPSSPSLHDESLHHHQRKDSQSSEIGLLSISGRTSRLSSIGSQGSGQSRLSNASHLSVISGQSGLSRSPSPHKMLLETSFCGTKPPEHSQNVVEQQGTKVETEVLEKVLLSRKVDPTKAVLAEDISVSMKNDNEASSDKPIKQLEYRVQSVKSDITIKVDEPSSTTTNISNKSTNIPKKIISQSGVEYIYIPLKGPLPIDDTPTINSKTTTTTSSMTKSQTKTKVREVKSATVQSKTTASKQSASKPRANSATPPPVAHKNGDEPKYIRIKLKPDFMYSQEDPNPIGDVQKPASLDLIESSSMQQQNFEQKSIHDVGRISHHHHTSITPCASPKLTKHTFVKDQIENKTPSPSLSRKSSFASIFRSKESTISPESPTMPGCRRKNTIAGILRETGEKVRERSRSRSKSRERSGGGDKSSLSTAPSSTESIDSKSKPKSVFSIFKPKKNDKNNRNDSDNHSSQECLPNIDGIIGKVEFKFNENSGKNLIKYYEQPLDGDSIRIPLHSPDDYHDADAKSMLQDLKTSSQDSQETVIEAVTSKNVEVVVETIPKDKGQTPKRQSSTSSENVVFSTKLGSNNDIFTTKLPKDTSNNKINEQTNGKACIIDTTVDVEGEEVEEVAGVEQQNGKTATNPDVIKLKRTTSSLNVKETIELTNNSSLTVKDAVEINIKETGSNRSSTIDDNNDRFSSDSERDSEMEFPPKPKKDVVELKLDLDNNEPERKNLVLQQDSYDDELPYIPTTLPQERSAAVPIIPIKQRSTYEMKTCPIERPRSTTPINPSCLEEYCEDVMAGINAENITKTIEKLKISLPRQESLDKPIKSPRKPAVVGNTWSEFAEKGISTGRRSSITTAATTITTTTTTTTATTGTTPPPLPPKGMPKEWINFEEIPERRKPPKRIQTLPSRGHIDVPESVLQQQQDNNVVYNYVNPEECKCECHEITAREREKLQREKIVVQEDELPLLDDNDEEKNGPDNGNQRLRLDVISDRRSVISDSSIDLSASVEQTEANGAIIDPILRTPFNSDLGVSSNRSSIVSQEEPQSPDSSGAPKTYPKAL